VRGVVCVLAVLASVQQNRAPVVQSIDVSVPFAPAMFSQEGRTQLAYELHVTNFQPVNVTVLALRIQGHGAPLAAYEGAELHQRMARAGFRNDDATPHVLAPGQRAVIHLWIEPPQMSDLASVTNTIDVEVQRPAGPDRISVEHVVTSRQFQLPLTVGPPLDGGHWVAIYDPLLKGGHRTAIYTLDGRARIPGRFAIDFIAMPAAGMWARDPQPRPPDWNGFGADVLAVADGTIAAAVDDTPDDLSQPVAPERGSGNYISIDLGAGRFAFYEHLQRGSVRVRAGQRVTRGAVIARLGSSGSTSIGPHLHFHVADANSLLGAEGVPFAVSRFTVFGSFVSLDALISGDKWSPGQLARPYFTTRPSPNTVISFQ
jgi:hypothetical protein